MVMRSFRWVGCFLLSTVQKVAPLFVVFSHRSYVHHLVVWAGVVRVLVGGFLGFNQSHLRSLMGYSSISHTGWIVCGGSSRLGLFVLYFFSYSVLLLFLFFSFEALGSVLVVDSSLGSDSSLLLSFLMLTLSGMPPFVVFFFKVGIIYFLCNVPLVIVGLLFGSILSIYYYFTFIIPSLSGHRRFSFSSSFFCLLSLSMFGVLFVLSLI